jgi:hypothetical protein
MNLFYFILVPKVSFVTIKTFNKEIYSLKLFKNTKVLESIT